MLSKNYGFSYSYSKALFKSPEENTFTHTVKFNVIFKLVKKTCSDFLSKNS